MTTSAAGLDPLFDPEVVQTPHDYYRHLRENDPVHEVPGTADLSGDPISTPFTTLSGDPRCSPACPGSCFARATGPLPVYARPGPAMSLLVTARGAGASPAPTLPTMADNAKL